MKEEDKRLVTAVSWFIYGFCLCMSMTLPLIEGANVEAGKVLYYLSWGSVMYVMWVVNKQ